MTTSVSIFEKAGKEVNTLLAKTGIKNIFEQTGLNWEVIQKPIFYADDTDEPDTLDFTGLTKIKGNFRSDNNQFLGIVSTNDYKVVQNLDAFNFIDEIEGFTFLRTGYTPDSKKIWVTGEADESFYIDGSKDKVRVFATFLHGHDGKSGIRLCITPIRVYCNNQLNYVFQKCSFKYSIKHTGNVEDKILQVQNAFNNIHIYLEELQHEIQYQIGIKMTADVVKQKIIDLFNFNKKDNETKIITERRQEDIDKVFALYENKDDIQNYKGTAFGMISAVSDFVSHIEPRRNSDIFYENQYVKAIEGSSLIELARDLVVV